MLCPDSREAHRIWKQLLPQQSPENGKSYKEYLSLMVTPFVLPYHVHSYQMTQIIPYLIDVCAANSSQCYMDDYAQFCFDNLNWIAKADDKSEDEFTKTWALLVSKKFGLKVTDILKLYTKIDSHKTDSRVRQYWKYGASIGISGAP